MEKKMEILAMDDDPLIVRFLEKALQKLNVVLHSASTGCAGIELLRQKKEEISMVLLDLSLSDKTWSDTADELQAIRSDIKIVISSGSMVEDQRHENDPRIYAHLPKPFSIPDLQKLIQDAQK
jgi:two-component system cell cycle sensor histidine kinase/response regulator CckA